MKLNDGAHLTLKVDGNVIADRVIYCSSSSSRREGLLSLDRLEREEGILMEMPRVSTWKEGPRHFDPYAGHALSDLRRMV